MQKSYIKPESLTSAEAQLVLDFLNGAQTVEEIADTIEIAGELDVGLRVAQRLLNRRNAVGGSFTDILQVADTPYVGPERFTEIIEVLTGRRAQRISESGVIPQTLLQEVRELTGHSAQRISESDAVPQTLLQEVRELREMVRFLQAKMDVRHRICMRLAQSGIYLGQSPTILIEIKDNPKNRRKANMPITLATSWGSLQTSVGFEKRHGSVVTAQTDINGTAKVQLIGPTYENLSDAQQVALDSALRILDPAAPNPNAVADELNTLVTRYQANGNIALRQAMDVYFNTRREALAGAINPPSSSFAWPYFDALITAYVHDDEQQHKYGNVVESTAVLKLRVKDWMVPWYQAYIKSLSNDCSISEDFSTLTSQISDKGLLLDSMVSRLHSYSSGQFGLIAESAAEKVARQEVSHFLATRMADLPFATSRMLFPALQLAARNITTSQMGTLEVVGQVRQDINQNMDTKINRLGDIGAFMKEVTSVQGQLDQFRSDYNQLQTDIGQFNENYGFFQTDLNQFDQNYGQFQTNYSRLQTDIGQFNENYGLFQTDLGNFNKNYGKFQNNLDQFDSNYAIYSDRYDDFISKEKTFNTSLTNVDSKLSGFNKNYENFTTAYSGFNVNITKFKTDYATFNSGYTKFQDNLDLFNSKYTSLTSSINTFNDSYSRFDNNYTIFSDRYNDFISKEKNVNTSLTNVDSKLSGFNKNYENFTAAYSAFNVNITKFKTDYATFNSGYTKFQNNLGLFNSKYTSFTSSINTFNDSYSRFDNNYKLFSDRYNDFVSKERTFNTSLTNVDSKLSGFNKNYENFTATYSAFNVNITKFKTNYTTFNRNYTKFKNDLRERG